MSLSISKVQYILDMFPNGIEVSRYSKYQFYCKIGVHCTELQLWKIEKEKDLNQGDDIITIGINYKVKYRLSQAQGHRDRIESLLCHVGCPQPLLSVVKKVKNSSDKVGHLKAEPDR